MAQRLTFEQKAANRKERKIRGYCRTAVRKLMDEDYRRGCNAQMVAISMAIYDKEIRPFVERAMTEVAPIHVPARAVKLYKEQ